LLVTQKKEKKEKKGERLNRGDENYFAIKGKKKKNGHRTQKKKVKKTAKDGGPVGNPLNPKAWEVVAVATQQKEKGGKKNFSIPPTN